MEYAPGPRTARITVLTVERERWKSFCPRLSMRTPSCRRQLSAAAYGVSRPTQRKMAGTRKIAAVQKEVTIAQFSVPSTRRVVATETLKTRSAAPAIPVGNIENSLCTLAGYAAFIERAIPIGPPPDPPLGGEVDGCGDVIFST
jgi:hypothetical protein